MHEDWLFHYDIAARYGGKTLRCAQDVHEFAKNKNARISLAGETISGIIETMVKGPSGILETSEPENPTVYNMAKRLIEWPKTGAQAVVLDWNTPERIIGRRIDGAWFQNTETHHAGLLPG